MERFFSFSSRCLVLSFLSQSVQNRFSKAQKHHSSSRPFSKALSPLKDDWPSRAEKWTHFLFRVFGEKFYLPPLASNSTFSLERIFSNCEDSFGGKLKYKYFGKQVRIWTPSPLSLFKFLFLQIFCIRCCGIFTVDIPSLDVFLFEISPDDYNNLSLVSYISQMIAFFW